MSAVTLYTKAPAAFLNKEVDWNTDTIKAILVTSSYTPDQDAHDYLDDVRAYEASGTGYTANGVTLTSPTVTVTAGSNRVTFDAADVTWTSISATFRYLVLVSYGPAATDGTRPLIGYVDFGTTVSPAGNDFLVTWDSAGIFYSTV